MPAESIHHRTRSSFDRDIEQSDSDEDEGLQRRPPEASTVQQQTSELMRALQTLESRQRLRTGDGSPPRFRHLASPQDSDDGDEAVQRLPEDIENLFKVMNSESFELPSWLANVAQAHGLTGLKFPCQAMSRYLSAGVTCVELQQRLGALQEAQGNLITNNTRTVMQAARYYMVYCIAQNVYQALSHLQAAYQSGPEAALIPIAAQVAAGFVHAQVYGDLTAVARALGPRRDPAARDFSPIVTDPAQRAIIQNKINELMPRFSSGIPEVLISYINYMLADRWTSPSRPERPNAS